MYLIPKLNKYKEVKTAVEEYHNLRERVEEEIGKLKGVNIGPYGDLNTLKGKVEEIRKSTSKEKEELEDEKEKIKEAYENYIAAKKIVERYQGPPVSKEEIDTFANLDERLIDAHRDYRSLKEEVKNIQKQLAENEEEQKKIRFKYPNAPEDIVGYLNKLKSDLERQAEYIKKREDLKGKEKALSEVERQIARIGNPEEELKEVQEALHDLRKKKEDVIREIGDTKQEIGNLTGDIDQINSKVKNLRNEMQEWRRLEKEKGWFERMQEVVEKRKSEFIESRKRLFESRVAHYFLNVLRHSSTYSKLELDEELMPVLWYHNGEKVSFSYTGRVKSGEVKPSGGEKTALFIAYIMALREIVGQEEGEAPLLILDEPTTHLDAERREEVWEIVDNLHKERDIQVILVTHDTDSFMKVLGDKPYVKAIRL